MDPRRLPLILEPAVLRWARERADYSVAALAKQVKVKTERVQEWEKSGTISMAQVDKLARVTRTPTGQLFLSTPPTETLTIRDLRVRDDADDAAPAPPSPELLETVYAMQRRQAWLRAELIETGQEPLGFVGRQQGSGNYAAVAAEMRAMLGLTAEWAKRHYTWAAALVGLRAALDAVGILVASNGAAGNNNRRRLNPDEFQGFALVDEYAPLIFINNADYRAAQAFTLAHELAHLCIGAEGVSALEALLPSDNEVERFCAAAAGEFLAPEAELRAFWSNWGDAPKSGDPCQLAVRRFKVSRIVAARRALDLGMMDRAAFLDSYSRYKAQRTHSFDDAVDGSDFWSNQRWRIGPRFAGAVMRAVRAGRLPYPEAYALTGLSGDRFAELPEKLGLEL